MSQNMLATLAIIILAGTTGGLANWIVGSPRLESSEEFRLGIFGYIFVGIVSAFTIPLFLSMAKSELLDKTMYGDSGGGDIESRFIFAGFCIVAAFSSRVFLSSISEKVLQLAKSADEKANSADKKADKAMEMVKEMAKEMAQHN